MKKVNPTAALVYVIDLDERGEFFADVRLSGSGETIFEIHGFSIFEDGFMKHKKDVEGLRKYLISLGVISESNPLDLMA